MRHRKNRGKLGRTSSHRIALKRNLARSLFQKERIVTTLEKAKEAAPFTEKLITLAKGKTLANYRRALALLPDKEVVKKLFEQIAPRFFARNGGYTRIFRLSENRLGDNASQAILELVEEKGPAEEAKGKKGEAKKRFFLKKRKAAEKKSRKEAGGKVSGKESKTAPEKEEERAESEKKEK